MHKKLALVLLEPDCSSWQSDSPPVNTPAWPALTHTTPWSASMAVANAWMQLFLSMMSWLTYPSNKG